MAVIDNLDIAMVFVSAVHMFCCPFTKVEESFNLQAMHDIIFHRTNFSAFDHHEFPGVVPRTFLGPIFICALSTPFYYFIRLFDLNKFFAQYIVRAMLALSVVFTFGKLRRTVRGIFGINVSVWFALITMSQYHFMFYLSRPLPNIMVLPLVLMSFHAWLKRRYKLFIWCSAAAIIIFRAELALLFGLLLLFELYYRRVSLARVLTISVPAGLFCIFLTTTIDSFFWNRLVWPEAEVFWFNTVLNKSSQWGTSPFLWYFYSAIPRAMASSMVFLPAAAIFDVRVRRLLLPSLTFVVLYSFLPHKELRFIIYVFPLLNIAVATFCSKTWCIYEKTGRAYVMVRLVTLHLFINLVFSCLLLTVATLNYPGGKAIFLLHKSEKDTANASVHIDVFSAQTGISRFTELHPGWSYNKTENLPAAGEDMLRFDYLLVEAKSRHSNKLKPYAGTHDILDYVEGFSHITFNYNAFPPIQLKVKPQIYILKRVIRRDDKILVDESLTKADRARLTNKVKNSALPYDESSADRKRTDDEYIAAVVEYRPIIRQMIDETILENVAQYENIIEEASKYGVDIIVFPEGGLTGFPFPEEAQTLKQHLTEIPAVDKNPSSSSNFTYGSEVLSRLSAAAKNSNSYVAFNLAEIEYCTDDNPNCSQNGTFHYNTNVVFDRNGRLIARCRKTNLFGAGVFHYPIDTDNVCTFTTDFNVVFGILICFDIIFPHPSMNIIRKWNITDVIYSTAWFSELPFFTAVEIQAAWSYSTRSNLLASGYNDPISTKGGSGIYGGTDGPLIVYTPDGKNMNRLLISSVVKKNFNMMSKSSKELFDQGRRQDEQYDRRSSSAIMINLTTTDLHQLPNNDKMFYWKDPSFGKFTVKTLLLLPPPVNNGHDQRSPPVNNGHDQLLPPPVNNGHDQLLPPPVNNGHDQLLPPPVNNGHDQLLPPPVNNGHDQLLPPPVNNGHDQLLPPSDRQLLTDNLTYASDDGFSCDVRVTYKIIITESVSFHIKLVAFSGIRTFTYTANHVQVCGLCACDSSYANGTCVSPQQLALNHVNGTDVFAIVIVRATIRVKSSSTTNVMIPLTLNEDFYPLNSEYFKFTSSLLSDQTYSADMELNRPVENLLTFAIYKLPSERSSWDSRLSDNNDFFNHNHNNKV